MRHLAHHATSIILCLAQLTACQTHDKKLPLLGPENHTVPSFTLVDQSGNASGSSELEGSVFVADFIFTRCATTCPKMTKVMTQVQEAFADDPSVKLVSFTVDPKNDSASVLADYMRRYGANPDTWTMFTGDKKALYALARSGFLLTAVEGDGGPQDFIHSDKIVLVDKKKRIRGQYNGTEPDVSKQLIADIRLLLKEDPN